MEKRAIFGGKLLPYLLLALLMKVEPCEYAYCAAPRGPRPSGGLDERMRRMEASVRARQYDWDDRFQRG